MVLAYDNHQIRSVNIIDDDPSVRVALGYPVEDLSLVAIDQPGPLVDLKRTLNLLRSNGEAAICDYHLRKRDYAEFDGASVVAGLYDFGYPAILCTRWEKAHVDEIRRLRRWIPILMKPDDLDPTSIRRGFEVCLNEFKGEFLSTRRPWRALVRISDLDKDGKYILVIVPAWSQNQGIKLFFDSLPENVRGKILAGNERLHAQVNIGAEEQEDIYFCDWEVE